VIGKRVNVSFASDVKVNVRHERPPLPAAETKNSLEALKAIATQLVWLERLVLLDEEASSDEEDAMSTTALHVDSSEASAEQAVVRLQAAARGKRARKERRDALLTSLALAREQVDDVAAAVHMGGETAPNTPRKRRTLPPGWPPGLAGPRRGSLPKGMPPPLPLDLDTPTLQQRGMPPPLPLDLDTPTLQRRGVPPPLPLDLDTPTLQRRAVDPLALPAGVPPYVDLNAPPLQRTMSEPLYQHMGEPARLTFLTESYTWPPEQASAVEEKWRNARSALLTVAESAESAWREASERAALLNPALNLELEAPLSPRRGDAPSSPRGDAPEFSEALSVPSPCDATMTPGWRRLARAEHWRRCPSCGAVVERGAPGGRARCLHCDTSFNWVDGELIEPVGSLKHLLIEVRWRRQQVQLNGEPPLSLAAALASSRLPRATRRVQAAAAGLRLLLRAVPPL